MREHPGPTRRSQLLDIKKGCLTIVHTTAASARTNMQTCLYGTVHECSQSCAGWSKILIPHHLKSLLNSTVQLHKYWTYSLICQASSLKENITLRTHLFANDTNIQFYFAMSAVSSRYIYRIDCR